LGQQAVQVENSGNQQSISIAQQAVLQIKHEANMIEVDNIQVPYRMTLSPIENTLNADQADQKVQP
jgi:hypothetical protein